MGYLGSPGSERPVGELNKPAGKLLDGLCGCVGKKFEGPEEWATEWAQGICCLSWLLKSTSQAEPGVAKPEPGQPGSRACVPTHMACSARCDMCPRLSTEPWTIHQLLSLSPSASVLCKLLALCQGGSLPYRCLGLGVTPGHTDSILECLWLQRSVSCSVLQGPSVPQPVPPLLIATRSLAALRHR